MENLWAPWRTEYIHCITNQKGKKGCLFCLLKRSRADAKNLILYRGNLSFIVMNRYPYNSGHLMVAPYRHIANFELLTTAEGEEIIKLLQQSLRVLKKEFHPHGFNIGANLGAVAGAGVTGHIHLHIVPRWQGDTNFMPVLATTKVVSEHLQSTYQRLVAHFSLK